MYPHIDWLSLTVKFSIGEDATDQDALRLALDEFEELLGEKLYTDIFMLHTWHPTTSRKPYRAAYMRDGGGFVVYFNGRLGHALLEVSGKGCEDLIALGHDVEFVERAKSRLTRIDIACDMLNEVNPLEFAAARTPGRFKSHSEFESQSGITAYVGSRESNRYARVYRYNDPHPRAHLLRCEYVMKKEDAKLTAEALLRDGLAGVAAALGVKFGWTHPAWDTNGINPAELPSYRAERREGKTLFWLADTVGPLLRRLHAEGVIDARQWFDETVSQYLDNPDAL